MHTIKHIKMYERFNLISHHDKIKHLKIRNKRGSKEKVSIITPTNKLIYKENIFQNYSRQIYPLKELIIILNNNQLNLTEWEKEIEGFNNIRLYQLDQSVTLGECLNFAITKAYGNYIAKFDDDDYYSPYYLLDQMQNITNSRFKIVAKGSQFVYFEDKNILMFCHPGNSYCFSTRVSGGSYLFRREVFDRIRFEHRNTAEDYNLNLRLFKLGFKIYSTDPFNYLVRRKADKKFHTWKIEDDQYLSLGQSILIEKSPEDYVTI